LRGIGALKRPNRQYRLARFRKAGVAQLGARYEREIGWIVVEPQCRSRGYSKLIVKSLLEAGKAAVFATTRVANEPMRRTLRSCGFAEVGSPFASERGDYELMLYVRPFLGN
jgi:RimJ/RimL family protein N-acetyltransferase